jgi:hypothetical protein
MLTYVEHRLAYVLRRKPMPEFVSVPVPVDRVQEVYELLARQPARPAASPPVTQEGYPEGWDKAMIDRMFVESSGAMRRILYSIADKSPSWVTTAEIGEASDLTARQVIAALGPFRKRVRGRYGIESWPFEARELAGAGITRYSMPDGIAGEITALMRRSEEWDRHSQA